MMNEFWCADGSSLDSIFWVQICESEHESKWWFRFGIKPVYRCARHISNMKYWLLWRFHPDHQYNIVKTGLKPGYYDADYLMLHACFALLCRYVEDEMGGETEMQLYIERLETKDNLKEQAEKDSEALALYKWWKFEKPAEEEYCDYLRRQPSRKEFRPLKKKIEDDEQIMLHRLIDIRRSLWT